MRTNRILRLAAAGDLHVRETALERWQRAFAALEGIDLVLLAGDLTAEGKLEQAETLARAIRESPAPLAAVLGNHDWHHGEEQAIAATLKDAGIIVLNRTCAILTLRDFSAGVIGCVGFVGGFRGAPMPDFGSPLQRQLDAQIEQDVDALDDGLDSLAGCTFRIVLLHYAPTSRTLIGEPTRVWPLLGSDRLAGPIMRHGPDLVLHGHAHAGTVDGSIGPVPVHNVALPVTRRDFSLFDVVN